MFGNKTALINDLERLYTLSDEKPNLKHLQTLSEEELQLVVGGTDMTDNGYIKPDYTPGVTLKPDPGETMACFYDAALKSWQCSVSRV